MIVQVAHGYLNIRTDTLSPNPNLNHILVFRHSKKHLRIDLEQSYVKLKKATKNGLSSESYIKLTYDHCQNLLFLSISLLNFSTDGIR